MTNWKKAEKLQKEFEAFGFFLNEHPLDDFLSDLRKRGIIFSDKLERDELEDGNLVKMAGVVAGSKHRSSAKGRFAYLTVSDPFGIFEAMIFDEAIITNARDILVDGSAISLECLIRKDDGGLRILVREVKKLDDFIRETKPAEKDFEDIKKQIMRQKKWSDKKPENKEVEVKIESKPQKNALEKVTIKIENREAIFRLKAFLSTHPAPLSSDAKSTIVYFQISEKTIEAGRYCLDQNDVARLQKIDGIAVLHQ